MNVIASAMFILYCNILNLYCKYTVEQYIYSIYTVEHLYCNILKYNCWAKWHANTLIAFTVLSVNL